MFLSNPTPRAEVRARLTELESFKIRISQRIKRLIRHAFYHHRHSAGRSPIYRGREAFHLIEVFSFDYYTGINILITDIVLWLEVPGELLKHCLQANIKAKISSTDRERTNAYKGFKGTWGEKKHCFLFMSYWVLPVLASRLYPRECLSNSRWCKVDFNTR